MRLLTGPESKYPVWWRAAAGLARHRYLAFGLVALLTGLAFLMRRKGLATQSLWFDEADLAARAGRDLSLILTDFLRPGENGPLYTLLMHFWLQVAGTGEAALRTPSLLAGTAVVPLIYLLGRRYLGGPPVGLLAAGLVTISPYMVWYSQDAKMYPLALALTVSSVLLFLTALENGGRRWWIAYIVLTTLSFYIHLMSVLIVGVELVYYWLSGRSRRLIDPVQRRRARYSLALLTLPYLPIALWQGRALFDGGIGKTWFEPVGLLEMLNTLGRRFGVNRIPDQTWETAGAVFFGLLAGLGLLAAWRAEASGPVEDKGGRPGRFDRLLGRLSGRRTALLLGLYLLLPVLAFYVLTTRIPLFADRYLLIASPAYYLLVAWGLAWLAARVWPLAVVGGLAAVLLSAAALFNFNYSEAPQKEDWRAAMNWLQSRLRPEDHVIVLPGYLKSAVDYYLRPGPVPVQTVPQELLDGRDDPALNAYLSSEGGLIRGRERVWLVVSPDRYQKDDPREYVRKVWFDNNTWLFHDPQVFVGVTIYGYTYKQIPGTNADFYPADPENRTDLTFGPSLRLEGYSFRPGIAAGLPAGRTRYDDYLRLTLYWRKAQPDTTDYEVRARVVDATGQDRNTVYTAAPLAGYYPVSRWKAREAVRDYRDIYIHLPPGQYYVELEVFPAGRAGLPLPVRGSLAGLPIEPGQTVTRLRLPQPFTVVP